MCDNQLKKLLMAAVQQKSMKCHAALIPKPILVLI